MIRSFYIDNFKSLVDFRLPPIPQALGALTCLVGLNGAGKSTVLQAFDFLGQLIRGDIDGWLREREWSKSELTSRFLKKQVIGFGITLEIDGLGAVEWEGAYNVSLQRCTAELVRANDGCVLKIGEQQLSVAGSDGKTLLYPLQVLDYQGSTLSFLKADKLHPALHVLKEQLGQLRSLDMLSPQSMRRRARKDIEIGFGGERLAALLAELAPVEIKEPLAAHAATRRTAGGPLPRSGLLVEEVENGISHELIPQLVEVLLNADRQILVTTHSPLVLNFMPDERAREAVVFLYRNEHGHTAAVRLFDLPSAHERLKAMGPGEVFLDLSLTSLPAEAALLLADA